MASPNIYANFKVIENALLTTKKTVEQQRTIKERFFSLPWRPFKKIKMVAVKVPSREIYFSNDTIFLHPVIAKELRERIPNLKATTFNEFK